MRTEPTSTHAPTPPRRILVADDEEAMLLLLRVNLSMRGFDVVEARDGAAALELARAQPFDLLLLDVMMPELSGFDAARELREDPATADIPFVFLSARADQTDRARGLELGALDYITKPFNPLELCDHLEAHLDAGTGS
jgi:DNA-binding response OmpR family regulator